MFGSQNDAIGMRRERHGRSSDTNLKFWTNFGLLVAVAIGILVVVFHGGRVTSGIAWSGASLALGGLLGFLFGIPGRSKALSRLISPV
jgi:hypothetical protein